MDHHLIVVPTKGVTVPVKHGKLGFATSSAKVFNLHVKSVQFAHIKPRAT